MIRLSLFVMVLISMLAGCSKAPKEQQVELTDLSTTAAFESAHATVSLSLSQATIIAKNSAVLDCAIHAARAAGYTVGSPQPVEAVDNSTPVDGADATASTIAT